jgi:tetratricopeptide (TPR) repeat protein
MVQRKSTPKAIAKPPAPPAPPAWIPPFALGALAFAVYANSLPNGFIVDDQFQVLRSPVVTGAQGLASAFGTGVWAFLGYRGNYFRPLQFVVYGLIYRMFGPSAPAFHLLMVLLHAVNTALVYSLARRLLAGRLGAAPWMAAALFAVHPIHTEAVNWIAALPDVLVTTFALAGLCAFTAQRAAPNAWQAATHCALYLAALLTKETGVMLLPLYAACQWLCGSRRNRAMYAGMLGAIAAYLAMRVHALGALAPAQSTFFHLGAAEFLMSAAVLTARYFAALVWPAELNFYHVFHATIRPTWELGMALAALAAIAWVTWQLRRREPVAAFAILWTAVALAPALNISGVGQNVFTERYLYLPSVGFALLAGLVWTRLASARPQWAWPAAAAILLVFSVESIARNRDWKDDFTLLAVTLRQSPDSGYLHNLMAGAWVQRDQFQKALEEQKLAVRYEPRAPVYRRNLGNILLVSDPAAAAREFAAVLALQPDLAAGHYDLGLAYKAMGETGKAEEEFRRAGAMEPR